MRIAINKKRRTQNERWANIMARITVAGGAPLMPEKLLEEMLLVEDARAIADANLQQEEMKYN